MKKFNFLLKVSHEFQFANILFKAASRLIRQGESLDNL